ncbi:dihydropteroate synthase [Galactobacter valiniphilus]|uniref:dihydropteroate synthase n=1 Tax=Galactobacter valiniphilus TaxID=2676122 RepID=UPI003736CBDF
MTVYLPPLRQAVRTLGEHTIDFSRRIVVMAIINRTPDSFFDAGATFALDQAVGAALAAEAAGAEWVDIGGVPFAPGPPLPWQEEAERVVPVVAGLRSAGGRAIVSVDTFDHRVAEAALAAGATVVNDTTGLSDPELAPLVAERGAHLVLTHSLAAPRTVYPRPHYDDVVHEVRAFLEERIERALAAGVPEERLIIDPGHDLNKNTLHSLELTRRLPELAALGLPLLAAVSNKDFIGEVLELPKAQRLAGSLAAATVCAEGGARILRMHHVAESVNAARMIEAIQGWREPAYLLHNQGEVNLP